MTRQPSVIALMMVRDEWPLCAVTISHVLGGHADCLWVVDHASARETRDGLESLRDIWGDRLHVVRLDMDSFYQEAVTSILLEMCDAQGEDWIYVVDADEIVLTAPDSTLRDVLRELDDETGTIHYGVENWISTRDFDEGAFDSYRTLRARAVPNIFVPDGTDVVDEIRRATINYFDLPFQSKIMVRREQAGWISSGAHQLTGREVVREPTVPADMVRVAHLPLLTRSRLGRRSAHGERLVRAGFPRSHGWQSQMVYAIDRDGSLDAFWARHSLLAGQFDGSGGRPTFRDDVSLVRALEPTLTMLSDRLGDADGARFRSPVMTSASTREPAVPFASALRALHSVQVVGTSLLTELRAARAERMQMASDLARAADERAGIADENVSLRTECDRMTEERDRLLTTQNEILAEREREVSWRDAVIATRTEELACVRGEVVTMKASRWWRARAVFARALGRAEQ